MVAALFYLKLQNYFTVKANCVVSVVAATPLLDCAVISSVYEPVGVGRLKGGPWL